MQRYKLCHVTLTQFYLTYKFYSNYLPVGYCRRSVFHYRRYVRESSVKVKQITIELVVYLYGQ